MTHDELQNELQQQLRKNDYYAYAVQYDNDNGTTHAQMIEHLCKKQIMKKSDTPTTVTENGKRQTYGNYNDNNVIMQKTFNHLNSLKRSMSLSFQSDDENTRLFHENNMFRELMNLELALRTMNKNLKSENE